MTARSRLLLLLAILTLGLGAAGLANWSGNRLGNWQSPPPIRIGVLHSLTGTMAVSEKPLVDAVRLAVEEINAGGGLLGRPVEMVVADARSERYLFAAEAERLISKEKVSALFACWTSDCRKAVKPVVERHRHLMFYAVQYEGLEQSPNIVYLGAAPNQQIIPGTRWAFDTLGRKVYLLGSDYIFPRSANQIIRDLAAANHATVLGERYLPLGASDVEAAMDDIRRLKPDVVLNTINGESNLHFFRALQAAGLDKVPVLSFSLAEAELQALGPQAFHPAHYVAWNYFQSLPSDANRRFVAAFQARFGKERVTSDPIESAYNAVHLWASAVRAAGSAAPEVINPIVGRQSLPGPSGIVALDAATRHLWRAVRIGRARADGQFDEVLASTGPLRPEPFPAYRTLGDWQDIMLRLATQRGNQP